MRLCLTARKPEANHIASILDPVMEEAGIPAALYEATNRPGEWTYAIYVDAGQTGSWRARVTDMLGSDAFGLPLTEETVADIDWVAETLKDLAPVSAGRFLVHGSHDRSASRSARIPLEIDAGQAFGTGHHGTTTGCLLMLEEVLRRRRPHHACDVGTGTAVLAIALAKAVPISVLATDIDPVAVSVARQNAARNGVARRVACHTAVGLNHRLYRDAPSADLIFANILARPLQGLAPAIANQAGAGTDIILSGLLPHQGQMIRSTYRNFGVVLRKQIIVDGWLTLLLGKR